MFKQTNLFFYCLLIINSVLLVKCRIFDDYDENFNNVDSVKELNNKLKSLDKNSQLLNVLSEDGTDSQLENDNNDPMKNLQNKLKLLEKNYQLSLQDGAVLIDLNKDDTVDSIYKWISQSKNPSVSVQKDNKNVKVSVDAVFDQNQGNSESVFVHEDVDFGVEALEVPTTENNNKIGWIEIGSIEISNPDNQFPKTTTEVDLSWRFNSDSINRNPDDSIFVNCYDVSEITDEQIIKNVIYRYERTLEISKIFTWISNCKRVEDKIIGYSTLYDAIVDGEIDDINRWTIKFAQQINPLVERGLHDKLQKYYGYKLMDLYTKLPICIAYLVSGDEIFIRNIKYQEYLSASNIREDSSKRDVFFKNLTQSNYYDSKWLPKIVDGNYGAKIVFNNVYYDEDLYSSFYINPDGDHILYTEKGSQSTWIVEPADISGNLCFLKSMSWGEYLCAYDARFYEMTDYRRLFTRSLTNKTDEACLFTFDSEEVTDYFLKNPSAFNSLRH